MARAVAAVPERDSRWLAKITSRVRVEAPSRVEWIGAAITTLLLVLSFPNFTFPLLAWIALVPLLLTVARRPKGYSAFLLGWFTGTLFFYATCYWLTYSMIHYGGLPTWLAYLLLFPCAIVVGFFPALAILATAFSLQQWQSKALFLTPFFWVASEWLRLEITGQLWNALGYSQAEIFGGIVTLPARFGGVYAVSFLIVLVSCAIAFIARQRSLRSMLVGGALLVVVPLSVFLSEHAVHNRSAPRNYLHVVAVQPNVPMTPVKSTEESQQLLERHLQLSAQGLQQLRSDSIPRLVIWPESPMNFTYGTDKNLQQLISKFTRDNHTSLLLNSLEAAPNDGGYNSALLINEDGRLIAQYDKIRLMPFGEYVPLPQWLGGSLISGIVGDFTPGTKYSLMPIARKQAGTFICIESAYPWIARRLTDEGADLLINISNDGYLGPTAVMHQHLANVIFRAVENGRPLLRVTNSGLSAKIRPDGFVDDVTRGFEPAVRVWEVSDEKTVTFYSKYGDVFVAVCAVLTGVALATLVFSRKRISNLR
jgi:apolipoprotein N-acyltransferase